MKHRSLGQEKAADAKPEEVGLLGGKFRPAANLHWVGGTVTRDVDLGCL